MKRNDKDEELTKLRQVKWQTSLSKRIEEFSELISNDDVFEKYFGEAYLEKLTAKSRAITRTIIKLAFVYAALMLSLYASQGANQSEFEVFGYGFKNLGQYKELLLFLAATITPISAILSAYHKYLVALAKECLKKISPDARIRQFYSHLFLDEYFEGLTGKNTGASTVWHGFTVFMMAACGLMLIFLFLTLLAGSFFIQINVIYDVAIRPASSHYVNLFVITYAIASILFSWLVSILQLPMPEVDLSNYAKLSKIKEEDPARYRELMREFAKESAKKDALSTIVISIVVYMLAFTAVTVLGSPGNLGELSSFLGRAMVGAFLVMFLSNETIGFISKQSRARFFRKYPDESDQRLRKFGRMEKLLSLNKLLTPLVLSLGYAFYAL